MEQTGEVAAEVRRFAETWGKAWAVGLAPVLAYNVWRIATGRPALSEGYDQAAAEHPIPVYGVTAYVVFHLAVAKHLPSVAKRYVKHLDVLSVIATLIRMAVARQQLSQEAARAGRA